MDVCNLRYENYSTGCYGQHKAGGVTLQFYCEVTYRNYYAIFNADVRRKRCIGDHKAGSRLPKGRFSVSRRSAFYKFWLSTGLNLPTRLSAFNDYMGKLKAFTFSADIVKGNRLDASSLCSLTAVLNTSNKVQTTAQQRPNYIQAITSNNTVVEAPVIVAVKENLTACANNYDISKQVSTNTSNPITPLDETKRVQNQTNEEWLAEYDEYF
jgi:hypothetical protein